MHLSIALATVAAAAAAQADIIMVVDLLTAPPPLQTVLAVQVCAGLFNRNVSAAGAAFTLMHAEDAQWLALLEPTTPVPPPLTPIAAFLDVCFAKVAAGRIRYNYTAQQLLIPNLLTLAAVLDAVPMEDGSPLLPPAAPLVYDAQVAWAGFSALNATAFMYRNHVNATTTMSKMNPGLDVQKDPVNPPLDGQPDLSLGDYIVKARLFNFYLVLGCIPGTAENDLVEAMAVANPWPRPIAVFGYDDTFPIAGDLFEAETTCTKARNMGQVATAGVNNLAFFSRKPAIMAPLMQHPAPTEAFNASKTYMALVVGDGDNVAYIKGDRFRWFQQRAAACASGTGCFPLLWSISPHLLQIAPDVLRWYFSSAAAGDYFVLPPSGHLYAYPGLMGPADQAAFVAATEADCVLLNTSASVEWEFAGTWPGAVAGYVPRYAAAGIVRSLYAVNVPYLVPVPEFGPDEFFKVVNGSSNSGSGSAGVPVVLFRPNEWRGTSGAAEPLLHPFLVNATEMAARVNGYPPGTVSHIYMTSDGGAKLQDYYDLVGALGEHVRVVSHAAAADLALQSHRYRAAAATEA